MVGLEGASVGLVGDVVGLAVGTTVDLLGMEVGLVGDRVGLVGIKDGNTGARLGLAVGPMDGVVVTGCIVGVALYAQQRGNDERQLFVAYGPDTTPGGHVREQ